MTVIKSTLTNGWTPALAQQIHYISNALSSVESLNFLFLLIQQNFVDFTMF